MYAPAYSALLPSLVERENLAAAISLNSAQMNGSRVIGPAIGGLLLHAVGADWVFFGNAVTYVFVIGALLAVTLPPPVGFDGREQHGAAAAHGRVPGRRGHDRVVTRCLVTIFVFSAFALDVRRSAVGRGRGEPRHPVRLGRLRPAVRDLRRRRRARRAVDRNRARATPAHLVGPRRACSGYAVVLAVFALLRSPALAFPVVAVLGFFYFAMVTSLSTALQERLDDSVRGRVMALWIMGFGGTVGLGNLVAGKVIDATSVTAVLLVNAAVAFALAWYADVSVPADAPPLVTVPAD